MRRHDKEITDQEEILQVIQKEKVCRLAMIDADGFPYVLPLNVGLAREEEQLCLYFHCANEGKKLDLLRITPKVAFEFDHLMDMKEGRIACGWSCLYESVCGKGVAEIIDLDEEKKRVGLTAIMRHLTGRHEFIFSEEAIKKTVVIRVVITELTGKHKLG